MKTPVSRIPSSLGSPTLPPHPVVPLLSFDETPLRRSTSSKRSAMYFSPGPDLKPAPQLPSIVSDLQPISQTSSSSFLPVLNDSTRPSSAVSVSSLGSLPSPLFNRELVDAFPAVPATTSATVISHKFPHREMNLATPVTSSFDTALLSSAIHLSSSRKATPKASFRPLPSEE